jgi:hypothetical protein
VLLLASGDLRRHYVFRLDRLAEAFWEAVLEGRKEILAGVDV